MLRVAVLISGTGTNLQALLESTRNGAVPAEIALVVASREDAAGLVRAERAGVPTAVVRPADHADRDAFDAAVDEVLRRHAVEFLCLAGWMRILGRAFLERWPDRILNIHPSLLPAFRGLETHARVLETGVPITGCTVHFVRPEIDAGPVLVQGVVPVLPGDSVESLRLRVLEIEHRIYPRALALVAAGRVAVEGERVRIADERPGERLVLHPFLFSLAAGSG